MVSGLSTSDTHIGFEVIDGTFYNSSYFIDAIPFIRITLDTRKHAQIHVFIGISCPVSFGRAARVIAITNPAFMIVYFGADSFDTVRPSIFLCNALVFHGKIRIIRAGWITVGIVSNLFEGTFISGVIRYQCPGKMKVME